MASRGTDRSEPPRTATATDLPTMITLALLSLVATAPTSFVAPSASPSILVHAIESQTVRERPDDVGDAIEAAGSDVTALLELAVAFEEAERSEDAKRVYASVIELDTDNAIARKALRHEFYDGRWFESYVELSRYKREEAVRMKKKGLVRFMDQWVLEEEIPYLRMGWTRDESGTWVDPVRVEQARLAAELEAAGHQFRSDDTSWIAPEDFDKWAATMWKCGDEWLDMEAADEYHGNPSTPWVVTGEHFVIHSTCAWATVNLARWHADRTQAHMLRIFGIAPEHRPDVLVVNGLAQYNSAAGGDWSDSEGYSSLHGAYFCDVAQIDAPAGSNESGRYLGRGVCYWATGDEKIGAWGPFWVRWAAAQSYVDAIDFSWQTVGVFVGPDEAIDPPTFAQKFWEEKRIPRWLRYGAASYVERFLPNPEVDASVAGANPWDLRDFAFKELREGEGLRSLSKLFDFGLSLEDIEDSARLYNEAGLVVSFLLDGGSDDEQLQAAHTDFRSALAAGDADAIAKSVKTLESTLKKRSRQIKKFAGL